MLRSLELDDETVADGDAAVHLRSKVEIMRGDDGGEAGGAHQLTERAEHMIGSAHIEIAGWLVGEQDARRVGDRARYCTRCCSPPESSAGRWFRRSFSPR